MPVVETEYEHIVPGDHQVLLIEGTTMKVIELNAQRAVAK